MKKLMILMVLTLAGASFTGCSMCEINESLAQDAVDTSKQSQKDLELVSGWLDKTLDGDTSWNEDESGEPIWESERDSMELNAKANVAACEELLDNAKAANKDD